MPIQVVVTAKGTNITAKVSIKGRPRWENFLAGYPIFKDILEDREMESEKVFKLIFGENYDTEKYRNACATRISIALLKSNITINKIEGVRLTKVTYGELLGKNVILAADEMETWLEKKFGTADIKVTRPGSIDMIKEKFSGKNGIYIMRPISQSNFGATGHCTLWIGDKTLGNHFAKDAHHVRLWELK